MKIDFYLPDLRGGGAQRMLINMACEFAKRGHDARILVVEATGPYREKIPPHIPCVNFGARRAVLSLPALVRNIKTHKPDILFSAMPYMNVLAVAAALFAGNRKTGTVISERNHFTKSLQQGDRFYSALLSGLVRIFYPRADRVVGISKGVTKDIAQVAKLKPDHALTIYNPVITQDMSGQYASSAPEKQGREEFVIVTAGRLVEQKDHKTLISAFAKLTRDIPGRLIILGVGPLEEQLRQQAKALGIADKVELPGFVSDPISVMKKADLFVISSAWEGFCNVIVEALYCGLPIVSTDCPSGPAEILDDGKYGTLVPVGNETALAEAMLAALQKGADPALQRERAMEFNVEVIVTQYEEIFTEIVKKRQF